MAESVEQSHLHSDFLGANEMADLHRMDRNCVCSIVFTDIVQFAKHSAEQQRRLKARLEGYLANAIQDVPEDERVMRDLGDGVAICFLGAPEAAMFAALALWQSLLSDARDHQRPLRVRIGINLGAVKLVKDINGALNPLGDGMNDAARIMSFAAENQILASESFFKIVGRLSDDYKALFTLKGVEKDKHVFEHVVYDLSPPGSDRGQVSVGPAADQTLRVPAPAWRPSSPGPERVPENAAENKVHARSRSIPLLVGGAILVAIAAAGAWRFYRRPPPPVPPVQLATKQTETLGTDQHKESLPPAELFTLENWIEFGWKRDGVAITRQGGEFVLAPPTLTSATVQFDVILMKGKRIEWVVGYRDGKNYDLFQVDETSFSRTPIDDGKHGKTVKVPYQAKLVSYNTFLVRITPQSIVHFMLRDQQWKPLDDWQPAKGVSAGRFGFHIPGKDQISLSDFRIVQN
jgi:class 3 adenylate cyclase